MLEVNIFCVINWASSSVKIYLGIDCGAMYSKFSVYFALPSISECTAGVLSFVLLIIRNNNDEVSKERHNYYIRLV